MCAPEEALRQHLGPVLDILGAATFEYVVSAAACLLQDVQELSLPGRYRICPVLQARRLPEHDSEWYL